MISPAHTNKAHRVGEWFGRACRAGARLDNLFARWLHSFGLPAALVVVLIWIIRVMVLAVALYLSLTLAVIAAVVLLFLMAVSHAGSSRQSEPKWRQGIDGYGLYCDEQRVDVVPDDRHIT